MNQKVRILLIGDNIAEREKISDTLKKLYNKGRVDVIESFKSLREYYNLSDYDIVICDFNLSDYNGIEVLFYVRERELHLPFIFISDSVWEESTIDTLVLNGASDYVSTDNLKALEFVVRREVNRYHHFRNTKLKLQASEFRFRSLVQSINGIVREIDLETLKNIYVSPQSMNILGYPASDWLENRHFWLEQVHPKDRNGIISKVNQVIQEGGHHTLEYRMISSQGDIVWIRDLLTIREENGVPVSLDGLMIDITNEKEILYQRDLAIEGEKRRMKEQKCLWNITNLDEQDFTIPQLLHRAMMLIPIGFQYPKLLGVKILYANEEFTSSKYEESDLVISSQNLKLRDDALSIKVVYLDDEPFQSGDIPFLEDEKHLLDTIIDILAVKIAKKRSSDDLKKHEQLLINTYELAQLGRMI
ncbi:MAG: PAS domain-containing protein [Bacteroidetes bacterium]|jgi:PAS domain S-box-containing protein|nr:PAS domain-containing protein [Bacteroidota bacterium]